MTLIEKLKQHRFFKDFLDPQTFGQFIRYFIVGISGFVVEYLLFLFMRQVLSIPEVVVNILVATFIFWLNFLLNKLFSFKSKGHFKRQLFFYCLLYLFNMVVGNYLIFSGIRHLLVLEYGEGSWPVMYLPKIIVMFFIVSWNFILYKKVIYK